MHIRITKGLDLKLSGEAAKTVADMPMPRYCYVHPADFKWMTPKLDVQEGVQVEIGTPLFYDKGNDQIRIVSPVKGTVRQVVRGEKRIILAIVIEVDADQPLCRQIDFPEPSNAEECTGLMCKYGLWPMLRQRPYSTIPDPEIQPKAVFISCFDSSPLAPDYAFILQGRGEDFCSGARVLQKLAQAPVHLCMREGADNALFDSLPDVEKHYVSGPHPAGNVGTQIHHIAPIRKGETVWFVNPEDVAAIGRFFARHELGFERTVALTGPCVQNPRYVRMPYGADLSALLDGMVETQCIASLQKNVRIISGNVLTGKTLDEWPSVRFHDRQITSIEEGGKREILGWLLPGFKKWSLSHTFLSWLTPKRTYQFNTSLHGGRRTFMMTDVYEKVFPFELLPLQLLKACAIKDIEQMEALGIYEVDPEDFALCEVVCPSKTECQKIVEEAMRQLRIEN
ncbi:MAG: Na(+)-translocating NADH-quinone reductase subunit A [Bacteroidales bacterium]|nr:Na(+)-translocating NADH-quinone reductase subunit A [Bacteroidales bacterium]